MIISIWLTAVAIQVGIIILLASQFAKYRPPSNDGSVSFSVVVAAHNEEENLAKLLPSLVSQQHSNFEIIIALDRCSDGSLSVVKEFSEVQFIEFNSTPSGNDPKKFALSSAIAAAKKDWLVFTDADCIPNSDNWLAQIEAATTKDKDILIGYSPYRSGGSLLHQFIQFEAFLTGFHYLSMALMSKPYMAVGRNMAVRRSFFEATGGYEDFKSVTGGDDDLFIQKNATKSNTGVYLGSQAAVLTVPKSTWREYFVQKTRHLSVGAKYSSSDQLLHFIYNSTLLLVWAFLPFLPIKLILPITFFYLSVKVIGYRFAQSKMGAGFNYILLPLVDVMYALILPIIAIRSKLVKDIRWKN